MRAWKVFCPPRLKILRRLLHGRTEFSLLDVGVDSLSPTKTKYWMPGCVYTAIDITEAVLTEEDWTHVDYFHLIAETDPDLSVLADASFDVIVMSHVLEHMPDPLGSLVALLPKLKPGGFIFLAFPSLRSLSLPSAEGTLNFCDDPTHIRIIDLREVAQTLLDHQVKVLKAGPNRDATRWLIGAVLYPIALLRKFLTGRMSARGLWHFTGFEDIVIGQRRPAGQEAASLAGNPAPRVATRRGTRQSAMISSASGGA